MEITDRIDRKKIIKFTIAAFFIGLFLGAFIFLKAVG